METSSEESKRLTTQHASHTISDEIACAPTTDINKLNYDQRLDLLLSEAQRIKADIERILQNG
jgi:hypothetical protein